MKGFAATVALDIKRQQRSGLYAIGVVGAVLFGLVGRFVMPERYAGQVLSGFYLLVLSSKSFVFCAAQVLLDRSQGTLLALRASPLTADAYLASKVLTLTAFSLVEATLIYVIAFWGAPLAPLPLALGVLGLGLMYSLIGLGLVAGHDSLLSFLLPGAAIVGVVSQMPVFYLLAVGPDMLYYLVPSMGPMLIMLASGESLSVAQWGYAIAMTTGVTGLLVFWVRRRFSTHVALSQHS